MAGVRTVQVEPVTASRLDDVAALFGATKTTTGCYCMWFVLPAKECSAGWGDGNRAKFAEMAAQAPPIGLLAYRDGEPVGWCAAGPRSRYTRALRSPLLAGRATDEDDSVWLVPCFYVRRDARRAGITKALLEAATALARAHGARAIEGFPHAGDARRSAGEAFVGVEPIFAACGFTATDRRTADRIVMRRPLRRAPLRRTPLRRS
jgi:GNAT superfamily N-acetyltransferase